MKALMIFGSIVGFLIGIGFGLAAESSWSTALWRACAAAFVSALLTRWWGSIWLGSFRDSVNSRRSVRPNPSTVAKPAAKL
jgi:hypothetical protein